MEGTHDTDRWIPAAEALHLTSLYCGANHNSENESAKEKAASLLFERLASRDLFASPKGLLPQYATDFTDIQRWYYLRLTEKTGEISRYQPENGNDLSHLAVPAEFWRPFQLSDKSAASDWNAGDFLFDNFCDSEGAWSGRVRNVHFDRLDLPASWLTQTQPRIFKEDEQVPEEGRESPSDSVNCTLPKFATKSERLNEAAAHAAAMIVRETKCSKAEAIRQVRNLVDARGRQEASIDRAIRNSYDLMYHAHGLPIQS